MKSNTGKILVYLFMGIFISCDSKKTPQEGNYEVSYSSLVDKLTNMRAIAKLPKNGEKSEMWSSYDRESKIDSGTGEYINWAANIDGLKPQYIRKEGENEVLAEMEGPGAIVRMWSASPKQGKVKIYIDGEENPVISESFIDYFKPSIPAFNFNELVYETGAKGFNNYVPIPYNKSCKIVAEPGWGQYYQFNYITFPEGTKLEKFEPNLKEGHKSALTSVNNFFKENLGKSPYENKDFETTKQEVSLSSGEQKTVVSLPGSGAITEFRVRVENKDSATIAEVLRKTSISMKWDGKAEAAVWSPLGDFFGTSPGWNNYQTLPMGMTEDWMYSYWYMPFSDGAEIILENEFDDNISLELEIKHEKIEGIENYGRFHAKWHRDLKPVSKDQWPDWKLLETRGAGRFVGTHLLVWNPKGGSCTLAGPGHYWWGEGDEKFFIDGEKFPSTFGTGTEDYFGYAWCDPSEFERAYHSQTQDNDNMGYQPMNRWHIIDNIPFQNSFDGYLEKYFPNEWPTQYATIVYWYLEPDGEDYLGEVPMDDRYGYEIPYDIFRKDNVIEGEHMEVLSNTGGWASTESFAHESLYKTVSGHKILLWFAEKDKENELSTQFTWPETGNYTIYANLIKSKEGGEFSIQLNEKLLDRVNLKNTDTLTTERIRLGNMNIEAGVQELKINYLGAKEDAPKPIKLDYLEFEKS